VCFGVLGSVWRCDIEGVWFGRRGGGGGGGAGGFSFHDTLQCRMFGLVIDYLMDLMVAVVSLECHSSCVG